MKYVKPEAKIINIENEDIVVASTCVGGPGSNACAVSGRTDMENSYTAMVQAGWCNQGSEGRYGDRGLWGTCTGTAVGIVCSQSRDPGRYENFIWCSGWLTGTNTGCGQVAGANSL